MVSLPIKKSRDTGRKNSSKIWNVYFVFIFLSTVILPIGFSLGDLPLMPVFLAMALLNLCLYPTVHYLTRLPFGVPAFPFFCLSYGFQFALPILTRDATINTAGGVVVYIDESDVISALSLTLVGICALLLGYFSMRLYRVGRVFPVINLHLNEKRAVVYCVCAGVLLPFTLAFLQQFTGDLSIQFSAIIFLLETQVLIAIAILGWLVYTGRARRWHKLLLYLIVGVAVLRGLASGMLEQTVVPFAVLFMIRWLYKGQIPYRAIILALTLFFFLTPVKAGFRDKYWTNSEVYGDTSTVDKASDFVTQGFEYWIGALSGTRDASEATSEALYRTDLIHQFAYIVSLTPNTIPYQYGGTYSYFLVAVVPRAIWADKPIAGEANRYYAVTYNITTELGAKRTTFGASLIGEGYINFGLAGVILVMALQGAFLYFLQYMFAGTKSGPGGQAVFAAFFVYFINGIGSSAEIMFGNIFQFLLVSCVLLWWVREKSRPEWVV